MFSWERVIDYFPKIFVKLPLTVEMVVLSFAIGLVLGLILALIRIKKVPVLNQIAALYISYVRCTPVICQLFVIYFGLPMFLTQIGSTVNTVDNIYYVIVAYSLNMGGFLGETIRASILAVPVSQSEAGQSVGLTGFQTMQHIVLPQALRIALPVPGTIFINLFNATALAYMVGVIDMVGKARAIGGVTGHFLEGYICCAIVFALISLVLEQIMNFANKRLDFSKRRTLKVAQIGG